VNTLLKIIFIIFALISNSLLFAGCAGAKKFCLNECKNEAGQILDCEDSCIAGFDQCEYAKGSSTDKCSEFQRLCSSKCFKVKDPQKCEKACGAGKLKCD